MNIDPDLFADVADALGIGSPAIVEKDVYAVQLIGLLAGVRSESFQLIFAGGTSLAKGHRNIFRMSEDVDIKLVARRESTSGLSQEALRKERRAVLGEVRRMIHGSPVLGLVGAVKRNQHRYAEFTVTYPRSQPAISALRPELKLDITASELFEPPATCSVSSLYAEALRIPPEVESFPVVSLRSTISEKLVALLRRTAHADRDPSRKDDETLVRHVYDLHMVAASGYEADTLRFLLTNVIRVDAEQFGNQHPSFRSDPVAELRYGLACLQDNPIHRERYERLIGPLVYHESPPSWDEALGTVLELTHKLLPSD